MRKLTLIFCIITISPAVGYADIIHFTDGMKTVCRDRAWEEGKEVKCEYGGTILSYQKADVLHIEKTEVKKIEPPPQQPESSSKAAAKTVPESTEIQPPVSRRKPLPVTDLKAVSNTAGAAKTKGMKFYNPRRPQKYWVSGSAKYQSLKEAIAALAKQYDRSEEWIQQHMGETNDLAEIHRNLAGSKSNAAVEIKTDPVDKLPEMLFYNPRRPYKYWTGAAAKHQTFEQAIAALAEEFGRSQEWVTQHMGDSNNLNEIRRNLEKRKLSEGSP